MQKPKKPMIVGFQRCGQNSLKQYLLKRYDEVARTEMLHADNGIRRFKETCMDEYFPVMITRHRPFAMWSRYWYFGFNEKMTFAEFLCQNDPQISPLYHTDFGLHITRWQFLDPMIYSMETLLHDPDFHHENKSKKKEFRQMTSKEKSLVEQVIRNYNRQFKIFYDDGDILTRAQ